MQPRKARDPMRMIVVARGTAAMHLAQKGLPLHVQSLSGDYVPAGPGALDRCERSEPHARWIYVVLAKDGYAQARSAAALAAHDRKHFSR